MDTSREPEETTSPSSPRLAEAVVHAFDKLRNWAMSRVTEVNEMTSRESLAVGDSLGSIVNQSRNYVEYIRSAMERFAGVGSDGHSTASAHANSGIAAIEDLNRMLSTYLKRLETALAAQDEVAQEALRQLGAVRRAGTQILEVSNQARMLAVNARIEAARLSDADSGAFGVIASEMSNFAKNMQTQSDEIVHIVDGLTSSLPAIAEMTDELRSSTSTFNSRFRDKNFEVSETVYLLQTTIGEVLAYGDEQIADVLRFSQDALSHLQFQDPCAQRLLQIEADILAAQRLTKNALNTGDLSEIEEMRAAESYRARAAGHVHIFDKEEIANENDGDHALAAGEVLLF